MHHEDFRMSTRKFEDLLQRIKPFIKHESTQIDPMGAAMRLAVTLRHLATGVSYRALPASQKLSPATVGKIVSEACQAIWEGLKEDFVASPDIE